MFGATPALFIIAGASILAIAGGLGVFAGAFVLIVTLIGSAWLFSPLWALLRRRQEWHAA
jgi:hypothetical protein